MLITGNLVALVPLAQLDRALGCGPKGRRFESSRAYFWRDARAVESGGLEIRCAGFRHPGFESLSLRYRSEESDIMEW